VYVHIYIPIRFFAVDFSSQAAQVGVTFDPQYGCANGRASYNYSASQALAAKARDVTLQANASVSLAAGRLMRNGAKTIYEI
jgi:hypothetical protein